MHTTPRHWLDTFAAALAQNDIDAAIGLFDADCYWRDLVAFTWNIRTAEGHAAIRTMLEATLAHTQPCAWKTSGEAKTGDSPDGATLESWFGFETGAGRGVGHVRLRNGKCWTLFTALRELKGFEEKAGVRRETGIAHGAIAGRKNWLERQRQEQAELGTLRQPYCLIVGGGQGGIALAARLRRLGVPAIVIEKNPRAGDAWRNRYKSLCLHDPVWYDHLPYLPFPDHWPVFTPKDKLGDWLEMYAKVMEINYWGATLCTGARYDASAGEWVVRIARDGAPLELRPKHLVLATGMSGVPSVPDIAGAASFRGTLCHSSAHPGGEGWRGKRCVVVGSSTSAHDICADLWEHGAEVTMLQRSPTVVVKSETLMEVAWSKLYSEAALAAGITTDIADLTAAAFPFKVLPALQQPVYDYIRQRDAAFYAALGRAGFLYDFGEDGSGLQSLYLRRGAGYYIEVGASQMIIDGRIRLKSGTGVARIKENSVMLEDGSELPADLIVFATGYGSMNGWAEQLISPQVAQTVGPCWGLGSATKNDPGPWQGELRNMWKPTRQPALWFHGGNLMQSRHYSLYLALQLKARMEGLPTPVY